MFYFFFNFRKRYLGDLTSDDFSTPRKAKRHFNAIKQTVIKQRKVVKNLHNTVRRLKLRTNNLTDLIKLLKEKAYITESSESAIMVIKNYNYYVFQQNIVLFLPFRRP